MKKNKKALAQPTQSEQQSNPTLQRGLVGISLSKREMFSGPLPPPEMLGKYEEICSGAADRIIKMAETQSSHRQKLENKVISSDIKNEKTGMNYSFILTGGFMIIGGILLILDKQAAGYLSLFGPVAFQAGNYGIQKYRQKQLPQKENKDIKNEKNLIKKDKKTKRVS